MIGYLLRELFREKTRIILTILAVAWGTFSISLMLSVGQGLRQTFGSSVKSAGYNLLDVFPGISSQDYQGVKSGSIINIYPYVYEDIKKSVSNIAAISQQYLVHYTLQYGSKKYTANIAAISPSFATIHQINIEPGGRFINHLDIDTRAKVIVLGTLAKEKLFPAHYNPVGSTIKFNGINMLVIGVMQPKQQMVSSDLPDENYSWIPQTTYRLLASSHTVDSIAISYQTPRLLPLMKQQIQTIIALANGASANDNEVVTFVDVSAQQRKTNEFLLGLEVFLGVLGALTLVVAGTGIANVMFASVKQNTREIGLRMAIGARPHQILIHYILESLLATGIGGIAGILVTALLVAGVDAIPLHGRVFDLFGKPQLVMSFSVVFTVLFILGIIGFCAGFFPARQAAAIQPAEALRHD